MWLDYNMFESFREQEHLSHFLTIFTVISFKWTEVIWFFFLFLFFYFFIFRCQQLQSSALVSHTDLSPHKHSELWVLARSNPAWDIKYVTLSRGAFRGLRCQLVTTCVVVMFFSDNRSLFFVNILLFGLVPVACSFTETNLEQDGNKTTQRLPVWTFYLLGSVRSSPTHRLRNYSYLSVKNKKVWRKGKKKDVSVSVIKRSRG